MERNAATGVEAIQQALTQSVCLCEWGDGDDPVLVEIRSECAMHGDASAAVAALDALVAERDRLAAALAEYEFKEVADLGC